MIELDIRRKIERGGYHLDRFEAWLDGEHVVTSRQPCYAGARKLIERGHDPDTPMRMHPDAKAFPLSWWAQWTVAESETRGPQRRKWSAFADVESPAADDGSGGTSGPETPIAR